MIEQSQPGYRVLYWLFLITLTLTLCKIYLDGMVWEEARMAFEQMMDGTAHRPYVYRVLIPTLSTLGTAVFPLPGTFYASILIGLAFIGFVITVRIFAGNFWNSTPIMDMVGILSIIALLPFMIYSKRVYDFPSLFLFTLGLLLMVKAKWGSFLVIYLLGCLNKETTLFLSVVFCACFWHQRHARRFWQLLAGQLAIFAIIRFAIMWQFQDNPGGVVEYHLIHHFIAFGLEPFRVLGYIVAGMIVIGLAIRDWRKKPFFLRQAALVLVPLLFVLYLLWGFPLEIRVFYEAYPLVLLLVIPVLHSRFGMQFCSTQRPGVTEASSLSLYAHPELAQSTYTSHF